jgi:ATP/maltotriose-dependent transcriptional regulator MalT
MIAVTRADPALRLEHLRAAGRLTEVHSRDLAFTVAEAHELMVVAEAA